MLVLIADEDASAREAARRSVERFGYRCIEAEHPDVVLVSSGVQAVNCQELCRRVRELQRSPACYVVVMVGADDGEGLFATMGSGADDFLTRPAIAEQLHARLQVAERFTLLYRQHGDSQAELDRARRALRASARTDSLTQLWNRLQLNDDLDLFSGTAPTVRTPLRRGNR
jgi:PleD family two-component response regulator